MPSARQMHADAETSGCSCIVSGIVVIVCIILFGSLIGAW